ncbi:VanZ family protein [uncultured Bradyrhizobium sp.]|jgi:VanZ family protein|uniref:VanZ family protein n=1 Tax=uncultured Bradyrhizobium sp. TaxID=199684 RepID=UPI00261028D1|nr:VanZ family protein [uncultured Bradyrhizobium sp.]
MNGMAKLYFISGWLLLALVAFFTLGPIYDRPVIAAPHLEHFVAFFALGLVFARAYPNRIVLVVLLVIGSAIALEALQLLTPDRHARLIDAFYKMAGGALGMALNWFAPGIAQVAKARVPGSR